jgi:hypothetical protein
MVRGMDNSIISQNGQNKARLPGRLGKSIVEEKEVEKVVEDEDKQDNALKASRSLFSSPSSPHMPQIMFIFLTKLLLNLEFSLPPFF